MINLVGLTKVLEHGGTRYKLMSLPSTAELLFRKVPGNAQKDGVQVHLKVHCLRVLEVLSPLESGDSGRNACLSIRLSTLSRRFVQDASPFELAHGIIEHKPLSER